MRTFKGNYRISRLRYEYEERFPEELPFSLRPPADSYAVRKNELRNRIISAGIYTLGQFEKIEAEGCSRVIANALCVSPFTGFRYFLGRRFAQAIVTGLKILIAAAEADTGEVVSPYTPDVYGPYRRSVESSPNISLRKIKDRYPMGIDMVLYNEIYNAGKKTGAYFPGINGILITGVEKLLDIYLAVEAGVCCGFPVCIACGDERLALWAEGNKGFNELLAGLSLPAESPGSSEGFMRGIPAEVSGENSISGTGAVYKCRQPAKRTVPDACIGCGKCIEVCPGYHDGRTRALDFFNGASQGGLRTGCAECGLCLYFCPGVRII